MAAELAQARSGCGLITDLQRAYRQYLLDHVAHPYIAKADRPTRAERMCRLKRLADPKAFDALTVVWEHWLEAAQAGAPTLVCSSPASGFMTPHRLMRELAQRDPIEQAHRGYARETDGSLPAAVANMYRQRVSRYVKAAEAFGLLKMEVVIDPANGKRVKRLLVTPKLDEMMVALGAKAVKLAAIRLPSGNGQPGTLLADRNR